MKPFQRVEVWKTEVKDAADTPALRNSGQHKAIAPDITVTEVIDVIAIGEHAAVVHFWSRLAAGAAHPAGAHNVDTLILAVVTGSDGGWRIRALENVTLTDPRTGTPVLRDRGQA